MPKQLAFHADLAKVVVWVGGTPVALNGEVDVVVKEPAKKSNGNKLAWSLVSKENATTVSVDGVQLGDV